jgi:hypothetical protein
MELQMTRIALVGLLMGLPLGAHADPINVDTITKVVAATRDLCLAGRQYDLKVSGDGSVLLSFPTPQGQLAETRITESKGAGGALNYENEEVRLKADQNILNCITTNLPVILKAFNVSLPESGSRKCRDPSHGIERYLREFDVTRDSGWRGGGYDPGRWCNDVVGELKGQFPSGRFNITGKNERSESKCAPFNCPQYLYTCTVRVQTEPVYIEKESLACGTR